jgi:hypothetical protein
MAHLRPGVFRRCRPAVRLARIDSDAVPSGCRSPTSSLAKVPDSGGAFGRAGEQRGVLAWPDSTTKMAPNQDARGKNGLRDLCRFRLATALAGEPIAAGSSPAGGAAGATHARVVGNAELAGELADPPHGPHTARPARPRNGLQRTQPVVAGNNRRVHTSAAFVPSAARTQQPATRTADLTPRAADGQSAGSSHASGSGLVTTSSTLLKAGPAGGRLRRPFSRRQRHDGHRQLDSPTITFPWDLHAVEPRQPGAA